LLIDPDAGEADVSGVDDLAGPGDGVTDVGYAVAVGVVPGPRQGVFHSGRAGDEIDLAALDLQGYGGLPGRVDRPAAVGNEEAVHELGGGDGVPGRDEVVSAERCEVGPTAVAGSRGRERRERRERPVDGGDRRRHGGCAVDAEPIGNLLTEGVGRGREVAVAVGALARDVRSVTATATIDGEEVTSAAHATYDAHTCGR
jgi:hypothetical protein